MNRLEKHIFAKTKADLLQPSQVTAALGLLKKVHPDLANQQIQADIDGELVVRWEK